MEYVETHGERSLEQLKAEHPDEHGKFDAMDKINSELFETLVMVTDGEAKLTVKSVSQCQGLIAYARLHARYNRRTLARLMRIHREVMYPKAAKSVKDLMAVILEWEAKWTKMTKEAFKDTFSEVPQIWKMAAFIELCPKEIQDQVYVVIDEIGEDYAKLREKVVAWASNKVEQGAVPMEIGMVDGEEHYGEDEYGRLPYHYDVDEVWPATQCYACGNYGHLARNCPGTAKGNQSGKGKGKSKGKSKGETMGKGAKGQEKGKGGYKGVKGAGGGKAYFDGKGFGRGSGGKGYQGECWRCGRVGHKALECFAVEDGCDAACGCEAEEVEEDCDGVWMVASVEADVELGEQGHVEKMEAEKIVEEVKEADDDMG